MLPEYIREVAKKATCLYDKKAIETALDRMAKEITQQFENANPLFLTVMIGGLMPAAGLLTRLEFPLEMDYIHATRYKNKLSGGELSWWAEPKMSMKDRVVIVIDDILDKGNTMNAVMDYCRSKGAKEVYSAVLVDKDCKRSETGLAKADFTGLIVENRYVFGYGLDYKGYLRNYPGVYGVAKEHE